MKRTIFRVIPVEGGWEARRGKKDPITLEFRLKKDAIADAVALAKETPNSQVVIYKKNGQIQSERTYPRSSDPKRFKG